MVDKIQGEGSILVPDRIFSIEIYIDRFNREHFVVNGVELKHLGFYCKDWLRQNTLLINNK